MSATPENIYTSYTCYIPPSVAGGSRIYTADPNIYTPTRGSTPSSGTRGRIDYAALASAERARLGRTLGALRETPPGLRNLGGMNPTDPIGIVRDHLPNLLDNLLADALLALLGTAWRAWQTWHRHRAAKILAAKESPPAELPPEPPAS